MLSRTAMFFLLTISFAVGLPMVTRGHKKQQASSQDRPLAVSTRRVARSDGRAAFNLTGRYQRGDKTVHLRATTVRDARRRSAIGRSRSKPLERPLSSQDSIQTSVRRFSARQQGQNPAPIEGDGDPGYSYFYSEGEMTKPDGTVLADAIYQYNSAASQNVVYITLHGVTLTFDLNADEVGPVSDSDLDQLNEWLATDDGHLVQQTGVALVQQGHQEPENEALLTYYLISLLVDIDSPTQAALKIITERDKTLGLHHAKSGVPVSRFHASPAHKYLLLAD